MMVVLMNNDDMEIIISSYTYFYTRNNHAGGVTIFLKLGKEIACREHHYSNTDEAINDVYLRTKLLFMAVCGDVERTS